MSQTRPFLYLRSHGNVLAYLDRIELDLPRWWTDVVVRISDRYLDRLAAYSPVGEEGDPRRKGEHPRHMRDAWRKKIVSKGLQTMMVLYNLKDYLDKVTGGRKAIDQIALGRRRREYDREKKRFVWRGMLLFYSGGRPVYTWRVGATRPNPFPRKAVVDSRREVETMLQKDVAAIIKRVGVVRSSATSTKT